MYISLLYLFLFNFAYLFFLSFLSFLLSQHICQFSFHCFIPHLAPCFSFVFQFVFQLVLFWQISFWCPLFAGSIYCTLFLLDCFDFAYGCIHVYSVTLFIVVMDLCLYIGLLQFCGVLPFFLFSFFFCFLSFLFFIILIFLNL